MVGVFLSPDDLALYQRLKRRQAEVLVTTDLPDDLIVDIAAAEYGAGPQ